MNNEEKELNPEKIKLTSWKNEPTFNELYKDYQSAQTDHSLFLTRLDIRKTNFDGGAKKNIPKGKSQVQPKLIRKQAEWKYPALEEPFLNSNKMFEIKPRTAEDVAAAEQNQTVLNYQWEVLLDKVSIVNSIVRTIVDEGTVVVKTGWDYDEKIVKVKKDFPIYASPEDSLKIISRAVQEGRIAPEEAEAMISAGEPIVVGQESKLVDEVITIRNQPSYEVCDNRNVIVDPTCNGNVEDIKFIIHEYETDMSTLKKNEYKKETIVDEETGEEEVYESGIYKNLDYIKPSDNYREFYNDTDQYETSFEFEDKPRKKLRAYEYWGYWDINNNEEYEPFVATWIGHTLVRMEKNPFPFDSLPFSFAKYMPIKNDIHGEADGDLLIENQESIGKMTRAAEDITSDQAIGQEYIDENLFPTPTQRDNHKAGRTVYYTTGMDPKRAIYKSSVDPVPRTVFDMISLQNADAESLTGTKAFSQGISSQALGSVATGIRSALDATAKRELSILRRLSNQLFKDMGRKTVAMNQAFLEEEEVIRITDGQYVTIRREDIQGEFDLIMSISTPEKDNETAEKLNMLMQTNAASMNPNLSKLIYSKIAKLWGQHDLAEEILTFEPEPDPMQEALAKMQMENATLENEKIKLEIANLAKNIESEDSKIVERNSRTAQNLESESIKNKASAKESLADAEEAKAKADKLRAETRKIHSETDLKDHDFVRKYSGDERREAEEDKEFQALVQAEQQERAYMENAKKNKSENNGTILKKDK